MLFNSRRSPILSTRGMVASSQPLATQAGIEILRQGGNAADAAVATAASLNITEPTSTGIGGDMFALYYDAKTKQVTALNGSGRAPSGLTIERIKKDGLFNEQRLEIGDSFHAHNITVPGACAGWFDLIKRHGSVPMKEILKPAIRLGEEGFPVSPITAYFWNRGVERFQLHTRGRAMTIEGRAPKAGELFINPDLAKTFRIVAEGGSESFYRGEIGKKIVETIQKYGGVMSEADLANHVSTWYEPISTTYRGVRVWE